MKQSTEEWLAAGAGLAILLGLLALLFRFSRTPPRAFRDLALRLGLSLRRERTGTWLSAQTSTWILEGDVDGVMVTVRDTYERVGARRGRRFEIVARAPAVFAERHVERRSHFTRVSEGSTVRVSGGPVFDADELDALLRWAGAGNAAQASSPARFDSNAGARYGRAFGFSAEELEANRAGRIHPTQVARALRAHRRTLFGHVGAAVGVLAVGLGLSAWFGAHVASPTSQIDQNATRVIALVSVLLSGLLLVVGFVATAKTRRRRIAAQSNRVHSAEGPAELVVLRGRRGAGDLRVLRLAGGSFPLSKDAASSLVPGARYRVYFVADELLSIEEG